MFLLLSYLTKAFEGKKYVKKNNDNSKVEVTKVHCNIMGAS